MQHALPSLNRRVAGQQFSFVFFVLALFCTGLAQAATYDLPAAIGTSPFNNCSLSSGTTYNCSGNIDLKKDSIINVTSSMTLNLTSGDFKADANLEINSNGNNFTISVPSGDIEIAKDFTGSVNLQAGGDIEIDKGAVIIGNLTAGDDIEVDKDAKITGNLVAGDELELGKNTVVTGSCTPSHPQCTQAIVPISEFRFDESGWSGVSGEVIDSLGSYSGTASGLNTLKPTTKNLTPAISGNPGTCSYGQFNRANKDYIALPSGFPNLGANGAAFTITAWVRTTDKTRPGQRIFVDDERNNRGYGFSIGDGGTGRLRFFSRGTPSALILDTGNVISNNTWYFVAAVADVPSKTKRIFVFQADGTPLASVSAKWTENSFGSDPGIASIGGETNAAGENNNAFGFAGNIDELRVYQSALNAGALDVIRQSTHACASALDHVRLNHTGVGVTCTGSLITVNACNSLDSGGTCTANTGGLSGNVVARSSNGVALATVPFIIAAGNSATIVTVPVATAQTVTFETSGLSVAPSNERTCWNGSVASCNHIYSDSGLIFDVPNHVSETVQSVNVSAVKKSDNSLACTPAFANAVKNIAFKCSYANPNSGTRPVRVNGGALNAANNAAAACDATGRAVNLSFNASGVASTTFQYADVGHVALAAVYTGLGSDTGLTMTGGDSFIAAPKDFAWSGITAGPIKAGNDFSATVTARNNAGVATPNFGKETAPEGVTLSFAKYQPTGALAVNGSFSGTVGTFSGGSATAGNLKWSEVGTIDLTATLASNSYLGSGLTATGSTGSTGAVGRFIPDHFDTVVTQGCSSGGFTYSGQPFMAQVTARNLAGGVTLNYDGSVNTAPSFAKVVTLSNAGATANFSNNAMLITDFAAGVGVNSNVSYTFPVKQTAPLTVTVRAQDTDSVTSGTVEGTALMRSGRLQMQNAYGSELLDLPLPLLAQYWNGSAWARHIDDSCTTITAPSAGAGLTFYPEVAANLPGNHLSATETTVTVSATGKLVAGDGQLKFSRPGLGNAGYVDLSIPLALQPWLQYPWLGAGNVDPKARATFGIFKSPLIYRRENY